MFWPRVGICALFLLFSSIFSWLSIQQHRALNTHALDLGQLDQAIWSTTQGRFMVNTLKPPNSMATHFSPGLMLLVPFYIAGFDIRILFVLQACALGSVGLVLYRFLERQSPIAGLMLAVSYYLNPFLHEVALSEFRRITIALPLIAIGLLGLAERRKGLTVFGLLSALLFKENVALLVAGVGAYLLLGRRQWKLGGSLLLFGGLWIVLVPLMVIPYFGGAKLGEIGWYPQLAYYQEGSGTLEGLSAALVSDPLGFIGDMLAAHKLRALAKVLLPTGYLIVLSPGTFALSLPYLAYMLASTDSDMSTFQSWYPAILLTIWSVAVARVLLRLKGRWRRVGALYLLAASLLSCRLLSPTPVGRHSQADRFRVTEHDRKVNVALALIPPEASVSAQTALVPHLSHRREVHLFPFQMKQADVIALDTRGHLYPESLPDYEVLVQELLADPEQRLIADVDGYYVFEDASLRIPNALQDRLGDTITLLGYDLARQDRQGAYQGCDQPCIAQPGQGLRLTLYWSSSGPEDLDYSVFVQLLSSSGQMIAQHDGWPGDGLRLTELRHQSAFKRTSQWTEGEVYRDVHYLLLSGNAPAGQARLQVGMYDLESGHRLEVHTNDGIPLADDSIPIMEIEVVVPP
jgi:uncharacterized membrane protein